MAASQIASQTPRKPTEHAGTPWNVRDANAEVRRKIRDSAGRLGRASWRLITQRSQVQILPPLQRIVAGQGPIPSQE